MMFNVLKTYHVMIGIPIIERHQAIFPPAPAPVPSVPHMCGAMLCMGPWGILTGKPNPTAISASGGVMLSQGTDIGPLIPHFNLIPLAPPNALLPVIILTSGSKSHFGAHANVAPQGPVAFAVAVVVNFNLNCAGPAWPPLPSGLVITFNTHTTGASIGDIVAGALHMVVDAAIQFGLNRLFAAPRVASLFERLTARLLDPIVKRLTGYVILEFAVTELTKSQWLGVAADQVLLSILPAKVAGILGLGSPVGYSPGYTPIGGYGGSALDRGHGAAQRAIDKFFNTPAVEQHPSAAPNAGSPPAATGAPTPVAPPATATPTGAPDAGGRPGPAPTP